MTARDRLIIVIVLVVAALGGYWFLALAPKRDDATKLQAQIDVATQQLEQAQAQAAGARQAKAHYNADYASLATLGKALPTNDGLPSLIEQLQTAAHDARVDLRSLKLSSASAAASTTPSNGTSTASPSSATPLPPGATVGSAGLPTMSFSFIFNGSYFDMERFLREVQRFVRLDGERVDVRGRLLSVDAFSLTAGPDGFPDVKANITATAYLRSADDDNGSVAATGTGSTGSGTTTTPPAPTASEVAQ
jgi:type II secretory pathway pseudopilin PulG